MTRARNSFLGTRVEHRDIGQNWNISQRRILELNGNGLLKWITCLGGEGWSSTDYMIARRSPPTTLTWPGESNLKISISISFNVFRKYIPDIARILIRWDYQIWPGYCLRNIRNRFLWFIMCNSLHASWGIWSWNRHCINYPLLLRLFFIRLLHRCLWVNTLLHHRFNHHGLWKFILPQAPVLIVPRNVDDIFTGRGVWCGS